MIPEDDYPRTPVVRLARNPIITKKNQTQRGTKKQSLQAKDRPRSNTVRRWARDIGALNRISQIPDPSAILHALRQIKQKERSLRIIERISHLPGTIDTGCGDRIHRDSNCPAVSIGCAFAEGHFVLFTSQHGVVGIIDVGELL